MHGFTKYVLRCVIAVSAAIAMNSCVSEDIQDEPVNTGDNTLLSIGFQLPQMEERSRAEGGYEDGVDYENYLDIPNKKYRIYFFDSADKYISRFIPLSFTASGGDNKNMYVAFGVMPNEISELTGFKVVVLANWPKFPDDSSLQPGVTTIGDLCNDASAQFDCLTDFNLSPAYGRLIPFFGVHSYEGVKIEKGQLNTLAEPIALLRAMAKIELVVNIDGVSLSNPGLRGFNSKGYCAPANVLSQDDYNHNGNWNEDYVKTPHLVGDANDAGQGTELLPLLCKQRHDGVNKETWIAYVPEYRNLASADGTENYKSFLEFNLDIQDEGAAPYKIYFRDYADGKEIAGTDFDILRNNCYRFTISIAHGALIINVKKWENAYDNKFTFE